MTKISLESAQRYYGTFVPWELDNKDLSIINHWRKQSINGDDMEIKNKPKIIEELWKKAQS